MKFKNVDNFLDEIMRDNIIIDYYEGEKYSTPIGFNIFSAISDTFYRENFHSDILKAFLSTNSGSDKGFGQHCEGDLFLQVFIDMINDDRAERGLSPIDGSLYRTATAEREPHRIDILIKGGNHCIIIENKINDAPDMDRQLPRYYWTMSQEGYVVDGIVYLTKTTEKAPDVSSWSPKEKEEILPLVTMIPANDMDGKRSLISDWITPCCDEASDPASSASLEQYKSLIKYLTPNFKKKAAMKDLLSFLQEQPTGVAADIFTFSKMMQELPSIMAESLREKVIALTSAERFSVKVGNWGANCCAITLGNRGDAIWIYCNASETAAYHLGFRGRWKEGDTAGYTIEWYPNSDVQISIDQNGAYLSNNFRFGKDGEKKLLRFITKLLKYAEEAGIITKL